MNREHLVAAGLSVWLAGCGAAGPPGPAGPAGPMGSDGSKGDKGDPEVVSPQLSLLSATAGFQDRVMELQLAGTGTHFADASAVDFGDSEIKLSQLRSLNETALRLALTIGAHAALGAHDVSVTSGAETVTLRSAFTVRAPARFFAPPAPLVVDQGGVMPLTLENLDYRDNPFSYPLEPAESHFLARYFYPAMAARASDGVLLLDATAPTGALQLTLSGPGPFGNVVKYATDPADPNVPLVRARAAVELTPGTAVLGQDFPAPFTSNLYKLTTAAANQTVLLSFGDLGAALAANSSYVQVNSAPQSGKFRAGEAAASFRIAAKKAVAMVSLGAAGTYYLATYGAEKTDSVSPPIAGPPTGGATGFTHSITAKLLGLDEKMLPKEPSGGDTPAAPLLDLGVLDASKLTRLVGGELDDWRDTDRLHLTVNSSGEYLISYAVTGRSPPPSINLFASPDCISSMVTTSYSSPVLVSLNAGTTYCLTIESSMGPYTMTIVKP